MQYLAESKARTSMGGTNLKATALSMNFQIRASLLLKRIQETNRWESSTEGKDNPADLSIEPSRIAQRLGSETDFVSSMTVSQTPPFSVRISAIDGVEASIGFQEEEDS